MIYFVPTTKYQIKFSSTQYNNNKNSKINIAVTGSCEGSLGHQVEQSPIHFKL